MKAFFTKPAIALAASCLALQPAAAESFVDFREAVRTAEPSLMTVIVDPNDVGDDNGQPGAAAEANPGERQPGGPRIEWFGIDGQPIGEIPGMGRRGLLQSASGETISSAFAVDDQTVIAHVGTPVQTVSVQDPRGEEVQGTIRAFDYVTGLAAIEVPEASYPALLVSAAETEPGMPIVAAWMDDGTLVTDAGMIATRPIASDPTVGATPRIDFGGGTQMSGAAVLDASGMLVGVLIPNQTGQQVCVPAAIVRRLIDAASKEQPDNLKRGLVGIQFQGGGALVAEVSPDSAADQAGIKAGDLVTQVGMLQVNSSSDVVAAVASARAGDTLDITVKRGKQTLTIPVTLAEHPRQLLARNGSPGGDFGMQRAFELRDGKLVPMEIEPNALPPVDADNFRDMLRRFDQQGVPIWPMPLEGQLDGFEVERSDVEETLKQLQQQMEKLNEKLDKNE